MPSTIRPTSQPDNAGGIGFDAGPVGGSQFRWIKKESKLVNYIMVRNAT